MDDFRKIVELPKNWKFQKLKFFSIVYTGNSLNDVQKEDFSLISSNTPYVATKDVEAETDIINYNNGINIPDNDLKLKRAYKNSLVLCVEGGSAGKKMAYLNKDICFVNKLCCIRSSVFMNSKYIYYYTKSKLFNNQFNLSLTGLIGGVSTSNLKNIFYSIPPLKEQDAIAGFLDKETARIDQLISKKQKMVSLLNDKKYSLIEITVAQGITKKDLKNIKSSRWFKQTDTQWGIRRLKHLFDIKKDIAGVDGLNILSVTQSGIKIKDISNNKGQLSMDYSKYQLVNQGEFVMNHMDLLTGFVDCSKFSGVTSPDYRVFRLKNLKNDKRYFNYIFQQCYKNKVFYYLGRGVSGLGRWRLPKDNFLNIILPNPSFEEQKQIADYLDKETTKIDKLIEKINLSVDKLKEYRVSLITEAVTGQLDIRSYKH